MRNKAEVKPLKMSVAEKKKLLTHYAIEYEKATRLTRNRIHLRGWGDKGKKISNRTYCMMPSRIFTKRGNFPRYYEVTEYPALVTCKRCMKKMRAMKGTYK